MTIEMPKVLKSQTLQFAVMAMLAAHFWPAFVSENAALILSGVFGVKETGKHVGAGLAKKA